MSSTKNGVILECDGETAASFNIPKSFNLNKFDLSKLNSQYTTNLGSGNISRECDFEWDNYNITIFAFTDGNAGSENKTDLPPPIDEQLYYGNIYVIAHNNGKIKDLSLETYKDFYTSAFGGFEDLGDEDSWSEEEEPTAEDLEFIVNDEEEEDDDYEEEEEEDEFSDDEEETEESGDFSVHSDNSTDNEALDLEESNIVESYCESIDKVLVKAPYSFKMKVYSFYKNEYDYLLKWTTHITTKDSTMKVWLNWLKNNKPQ